MIIHASLAKSGMRLWVEIQNDRHDHQQKAAIQMKPFRYDGQAGGLAVEVFWLVFWLFSSSRIAVVRLSLALL